MSPDLVMRSVEQRGTAGGREMRIDVAYDAGRATGVLYVDANGVEYRVCERCGGNMYKEGNTWTCEQCGLSYTE